MNTKIITSMIMENTRIRKHHAIAILAGAFSWAWMTLAQAIHPASYLHRFFSVSAHWRLTIYSLTAWVLMAVWKLSPSSLAHSLNIDVTERRVKPRSTTRQQAQKYVIDEICFLSRWTARRRKHWLQPVTWRWSIVNLGVSLYRLFNTAMEILTLGLGLSGCLHLVRCNVVVW